MSEYVDVSDANGIRTIRFNRPDKKNALLQEMYGAATDAINQAQEDGTRVLLLTGTGDAFTAGNDLHDFLNGNRDPSGGAPAFLVALANNEVPMVAAVNGMAVGVGTTMLLHCDFVYAAEAARFHMPFINLALVPEASSSMLLPRLAGYPKAAELLMLGEPFSPTDAVEIGLAAAVVPDGELMDRAMETAAKLAAKAPTALRATKRLMRRPQEPLLDRIIAEGEAFAAQLQSPEAREAMMAVLEKRPPDFSKVADAAE